MKRYGVESLQLNYALQPQLCDYVIEESTTMYDSTTAKYALQRIDNQIQYTKQ